MTVTSSAHTARRRRFLLALILLALFPASQALPAQTAQATVFYVATDGSNSGGDGSIARPWATITHAVNTVPDGSTILVKPGTYTGEVRLDRMFSTGITVRSMTPYQARLRNLPGEKGVRSFCGRRITLSQFDIAHAGANPLDVLVHIQATDDVYEPTGEPCATREMTIQGNIIHDSLKNDLLKINNGARQITVTGNLFYNQRGSDEHIDINSVVDVVVQDNIFLNAPTNGSETHAFIVVKDSNDADDGIEGTRNVTLRRNVFLGWIGSLGYGFIQIGEDGKPYYEAEQVLIENNLLLHHSPNQMNAPFAVMGSKDVTIRNNTFVGDGPAAAWMRVYRVGENQPATNVRFFNNIWSRPGGGLERFSRSPQGEVGAYTLGRNLYWNGGQAIPRSSSQTINIDADARALLANPALPSLTGLVAPFWEPERNRFADGSTSIQAAFQQLVSRYGTLPGNSPARGAADPANAPGDDIFGRARGASPDLGAVQVQATPTLDRKLYLPALAQ